MGLAPRDNYFIFIFFQIDFFLFKWIFKILDCLHPLVTTVYQKFVCSKFECMQSFKEKNILNKGKRGRKGERVIEEREERRSGKVRKKMREKIS
jgi:hypothetical protein